MGIGLDSGTIIAVDGVLCIYGSKFNLASADSITKSTRSEVLFGRIDCLLTDHLNPELRQVNGLQPWWVVSFCW